MDCILSFVVVLIKLNHSYIAVKFYTVLDQFLTLLPVSTQCLFYLLDRKTTTYPPIACKRLG